MEGWVGLGSTTVSKQSAEDHYVTAITGERRTHNLSPQARKLTTEPLWVLLNCQMPDWQQELHAGEAIKPILWKFCLTLVTGHNLHMMYVRPGSMSPLPIFIFTAISEPKVLAISISIFITLAYSHSKMLKNCPTFSTVTLSYVLFKAHDSNGYFISAIFTL